MTNNTWSYLHVESKLVKLLEAENRIVVAREWGEGEMGSCLMGIKLQLY